MPKLKVRPGDKAPDFEALDDKGSFVRISDFYGNKHIVLYFYPRDHTPGCTLEARGFNQLFSEFEKRNTAVLGLSTDAVTSHRRFSDSCALNFRLVADPEGRIARAYGALSGLLGIFGIASRVTVLIDKTGIVRAAWGAVSPRGHAEEVLREIDRIALD